MKEDFDIQISGETQQPDQNTADSVQLPMNLLAMGEMEPDDVKVYIRQTVYKALEKYALADVDHERGTIILGEYSEEMGKTHVVISDYIEARYTDASASTLTFTHETWDYVHRQHDEKYPDKKIVGWQHTHPGYGIFLSNYDLFIHENFFNLPFQIAYVIDPVQQLRGFFQWKNGRIEKLKGFYIYDEVGKTIKIDREKPKEKPAGESKGKGSYPLLSVLSLALALLIAVTGFITAMIMRDEINSQADRIASQAETIRDQQEQINDLDAAMEILRKKKNDSASADDFILYTVKRGDSLEKICSKLNINYAKYKSVILSLNRIQNENAIITGYVLISPKSIQNQ